MGVAEVVDHNVQCGEEGVPIEHKSSVPFPWGSGSKPTLVCGHLPLKLRGITHTKRLRFSSQIFSPIEGSQAHLEVVLNLPEGVVCEPEFYGAVRHCFEGGED